MIQNRRLAMWVLLILGSLVPLSAQAQFYPGTECVDGLHSVSKVYHVGGKAENPRQTTSIFYCPIPLQGNTSQLETAVRFHNAHPTSNVACFIQACDFQFGNCSASPVVTMAPGATVLGVEMMEVSVGLSANMWASLVCEIPGISNGSRSGILTYFVNEY